MDGVSLISAPREVQISRLMQRSGLTRREADERIAAQMPLEEKARRATWVVDNSGDLPATHARLSKIWDEIRRAP